LENIGIIVQQGLARTRLQDALFKTKHNLAYQDVGENVQSIVNYTRLEALIAGVRKKKI